MEVNFKLMSALALLSGLVLCSMSAQGAAMCSASSSSSASGTLTDSGGSSGRYSNNESCDFLIQPSGASSITLEFSSFKLENNFDFLTIYDGATDSAPELADLTGNRNPSDVTSTGGAMLVRFTSDSSVTRSGFVANWTSASASSCGGTSTDATGTHTDSGGSSGNYSNNEVCEFLIQPTGAASITLTFSAFDLESNFDFLTIYDGATTSASVISSNLSGSSLPSSVTSTGGAMLIRFTSDGSVTEAGFVSNWTSSTSGGGGSCSLETVADNFPNVSYSQNSGSENWSGSWIEVGESDGVSAGISRVRSDLCTSGNCLRFGVPSGGSAQTYSNRGLLREADLGSASSATLSFVYRSGVNQGSQTLVLSISNNGGSSWTDLQSYFINSTNTSSTSASFDISAFTASNTQIRFLASGSNAVLGMYIDDISIRYQPDCTPIPVANYYFDANSWDGTADEVIDSSGNGHHGVASGMTTTDDAQVCAAGDFTSVGTTDYLSLAKDAVDGLNDFTISIWANVDSLNDDTILSGAKSSEFNEMLMFFEDSSDFLPLVGGSSPTLSNGSFADGDWHHLSWTRQGTSHCFYVDGSLVECDTGGSGDAIDVDAGGLIVGQEQDSVGGGFVSSQAWDGLLDELIIFGSKLEAAQINTIYTNQEAGNNYDGTSRTCPVRPAVSVHHYEIVHDGQGLTCDDEIVTIKACANADCSSLSSDPGTVDFLVDGSVVTSPTFTGSANVSFNNVDEETVTLSLDNPTIAAANPLECDDGAGSSCDLVFTHAGFRFLSGAANNTTIPNQTSGTVFADSLKIQAVENTDGVCTGLFSGSAEVHLSQENVDPGGVGGLSFSSGGTTLAKHSSATSVTLTFGADSIATIPTPRYLDAGEIRLRASYDLAGVSLTGSSNTFWVAPAQLTITAASGGVPLNGSSATATPTHKAGENFDLAVTAYNSLGAVTSNYEPGQLQFKFTRTGPTSSGSVDGTVRYASGSSATTSLSAAFQNVTLTSFVSGVSTYAEARYSEVGIIDIDVQDANYGNSSIVVSASSVSVGRFTPSHFEQTVAQAGILHATCGASSTFSAYSGQKDEASSSLGAISYSANPVLAITAYNAQGNVTQNYYEDSAGSANDYMKLTGSNISILSPVEDGVAVGVNGSRLPLTSNLSAGTLSQNDLTGLFGGGALPRGVLHYQMSNADNFFYNRSANSIVAPFTSDIDFSVTSIIDSDNVSATSTVDASPTGVEIRFGRLRLDNSFGPEITSIPQPIQAEYFDGSGYALASNNSCTSYDASEISLTNISLDPTLTSAIGGSGQLTTGETTDIQLAASGAGNQGNVGVTYDIFSWLEFDWDNDGSFDDDPSAIATFGVYRGHDKVIYWREVF